jgi:predicted ArsR family transcriptional regulator
MNTGATILAALADGRARTVLELRGATGLGEHVAHAGLRRLLGGGVVRFRGAPPVTGCGRPATLWRIDPCHEFRAFRAPRVTTK